MECILCINKGVVFTQVQLKPWGNSQGIRFSKELLNAAGMSTNETLDVTITDGQILLSRKFRHRSLIERAEEYGGKLNFSDEINWEMPAGNEVW